MPPRSMIIKGVVHRNLTARASILALALTFLVGLGGEAYGPHHPNEVAATSDAHRIADPDSHRPSPDGADHPPCTCIGTCHGAAAAPLPGYAPVPPSAGPADRRPERCALADAFIAPPLPYLLPYATAPPTPGRRSLT